MHLLRFVPMKVSQKMLEVRLNPSLMSARPRLRRCFLDLVDPTSDHSADSYSQCLTPAQRRPLIALAHFRILRLSLPALADQRLLRDPRTHGNWDSETSAKKGK